MIIAAWVLLIACVLITAWGFWECDRSPNWWWFAATFLLTVFILSACTTPTSPDKPCTRQEIHHGDTVTVPCVMHGVVGDSVGVLLD